MSDSASAALTVERIPEVSKSVPGSFHGSVLNGLAWKAASRGTFEVTRLAVAIALARLLTPHEYGLAGFALVLVAFQPVFCGTALASALVQREHVTENDRSTVFWCSAATGLFFTILGVSLSWILTSAFGDPQAAPLFAAMSLCYVISALGITQTELLIRAMKFRSLELRTMAGVIIGALLAIAAALLGWGPWAIVLQQLGYYTAATVLLWLMSDWHPHFIFSRQSLHEIRGFGGNTSGAMLLYVMNQNTSRVLIGGALGTAALGAFALGYNVILAPFSRITSPLFDVLYTVYAKLRDDRERLVNAWLRVVRLTVAITLPAMLGLIVVAPDLVPVVFGAQWHDAVPVIQILAWVGVLIALQGVNEIILQSVDRTEVAFRFAAVLFVTGVASFLIGLPWGIVGVSAGYAIVSTIVQPWYTHQTARAVGTGLGAYLQAVSGVLQASALSTGAIFITRELLRSEGASAVSRLVATACVGTLTFAAAARWRAPDLVVEVKGLIRRRRQPDSSVAELH
jgi:O-antigen/teichoic acid export membrane protein